jgi:hypothetical protein
MNFKTVKNRIIHIERNNRLDIIRILFDSRHNSSDETLFTYLLSIVL